MDRGGGGGSPPPSVYGCERAQGAELVTKNVASKRLTFTTDVQRADFAGIPRDAKSAGLLPMDADLSRLFAKP